MMIKNDFFILFQNNNRFKLSFLIFIKIMALSSLVDKMDEFLNRGDMYIVNNKPETAKGCYLKALEKSKELESIYNVNENNYNN